MQQLDVFFYILTFSLLQLFSSHFCGTDKLSLTTAAASRGRFYGNKRKQKESELLSNLRFSFLLIPQHLCFCFVAVKATLCLGEIGRAHV